MTFWLWILWKQRFCHWETKGTLGIAWSKKFVYQCETCNKMKKMCEHFYGTCRDIASNGIFPPLKLNYVTNYRIVPGINSEARKYWNMLWLLGKMHYKVLEKLGNIFGNTLKYVKCWENVGNAWKCYEIFYPVNNTWKYNTISGNIRNYRKHWKMQDSVSKCRKTLKVPRNSSQC